MFYLTFMASNLGRKKVRTTLTLLSIMIAFLLFGLLRSLSAAFDLGAKIAGEDRLVSTNKVTLIQPLPFSYLEKVRRLENVDKVTMANWFGGYYQDKKNQFPQFAVNADDYFAIYKDLYSLSPAQMQAWKSNRFGAVVGQSLANKYHWQIGDRIPLVGIFSQNNNSIHWEFVLEGIYTTKNKSGDSNLMFFHYDYFDKSRQYFTGTVGWLIVKVKDPKRSAQTALAIDNMFANSAAETKTSSEKDFVKSFAKQFGDIGLITTLILTAVFFTMLLVVGNTMAQSFRERIAEFAILKTLGFSDVWVMLMVLAEALFISLAGGLLGLALAELVLAMLADTLASTLPGLVISWRIAGTGVLLMLVLGLVTGAVPAVQGLRLNIIAALQRR